MLELFTLSNLVALLTLSALEIVLGIDNIVFIAIVASKLPPAQREKARIVGLSLAIITRLLLLTTLATLASLTEPVVTFFNHGFSIRDLILLGGGIFLIFKATKEIHLMTKSKAEQKKEKEFSTKSFAGVIALILVIDIVFSLDSVITAVGMTNNIPVMAAAIIIAVLIMLLCSGYIVRFIERNPSIKMLALSFLELVGVMLIIEGMGHHVEKGYIYFAMAFSLVVEMLNIKADKKIS